MNYTSKDIKWLKLCVEGAKIFATCGKRQYFAVILDPNGHVLGTGYNGGPKGTKHCIDGGCPRFIEGTPNGASYDNCIAIHAEQNALLHSDYNARIAGSTLYVNGPPCSTCAKLIANSGITRIVHMPDAAYAQWDEIKTSLEALGIEVVTIDLGWVEVDIS